MPSTSWRFFGVVALALTAACGESTREESSDDDDAASAGTGASTHGGSSGQGGGATAGQSTGGAGMGGAATNGGGAGSGATPNAGGMAGAPSAETLTSCAAWTVEYGDGSTSTAELVEGGLLLKRPGGSWSDWGSYNSADIALSQSGLTGDFHVVVSFDQLQPSDGVPFVGPKFQAGVWHHDPKSGQISQAHGSVGQQSANVWTAVWSSESGGSFYVESVDHVADAVWLVGAAGTIELSRVGTSITSTITVNGESATYTPMEAFDVDPLELFIALGNSDEDYGKTDTSVRVTSVMVTGQGVSSDTFDCAP